MKVITNVVLVTLLIAFLCSCSKKVEPHEIEKAVLVADDPEAEKSTKVISLSNYLYNPQSGNAFLSKINTDSISNWKVTADMENLFYCSNDSIFLKPAAKNQLLQGERLLLSIEYQVGKKLGHSSFVIMLDDFIKNKVVAHRGAWKAKGLPQNSLASLKHALDIGCQASEFDVWLTADKVLVINHDNTFGGKDIERSTYADLQTTGLSNGEILPTLKDFIGTVVKQSKTGVYLEIKGSLISENRNIEVADSILSLNYTLKAQPWVTYVSLNTTALSRIMKNDKFARTLYAGGDLSLERITFYHFTGIDYEVGIIKSNPELIAQAFARGLHSSTWTVNDLPTLQYVISLNVNTITTDDPEKLINLHAF
jgi:glycerophosphoryl diester phosphodiesterase